MFFGIINPVQLTARERMHSSIYIHSKSKIYRYQTHTQDTNLSSLASYYKSLRYRKFQIPEKQNVQGKVMITSNNYRSHAVFAMALPGPMIYLPIGWLHRHDASPLAPPPTVELVYRSENVFLTALGSNSGEGSCPFSLPSGIVVSPSELKYPP